MTFPILAKYAAGYVEDRGKPPRVVRIGQALDDSTIERASFAFLAM